MTLEGVPPLKNQKQPPADLFEEIFEIQELLEAFQRGGARQDTEKEDLKKSLSHEKQELEKRQEGLERRLGDLFHCWDRYQEGERQEKDLGEGKQILDEMRDILSTRSYLATVIRDLRRALASQGV